VSFETNFDSKQPKLEPKLVSALSETKCLFRLFHFYTETESFDVSIEPKQTKDQPKQFDREHILVFFRKFWVVSVCFGLIQNSAVCFGCFDIGSKHRNKPKQTKNFSFWFHETQPKQILFRFFSVRTRILFSFRGHPSSDEEVFKYDYAKIAYLNIRILLIGGFPPVGVEDINLLVRTLFV
jgi:hypothetical protein